MGTRAEFLLPDVGEGIAEGEIVEWHVSVGSPVREDQPLVDVQTDKSVVELPSPYTGTLVAQGGAPGDILPVGALLAAIEVAASAPGDRPAVAAPAPAASTSPAPAAPSSPAPAPAPARSGRRALASPATRRLALEMGIDLSTVEGSGPQGRVSADDVRRAAGAAAAPDAVPAPAPEGAATPARAAVPASAPRGIPAEDRVVPLRGIRRQVARSMTQSWQTVPHITELREVEADNLIAARRSLQPRFEADGAKLSYLPILVKATAVALRRHPELNASLDIDAEEITYRGAVNIGIATSTDAGLVVPVITDADQRSLRSIAAELDALASAARDGRLTLDQMSGGTFTISNFGSFGSWLGTPIIRPPEAGIAGFGRIREAVVPVDGQPAVRNILPMAVSADHRLIDGAGLAAFIDVIAEIVLDPIVLLVAEG